MLLLHPVAGACEELPRGWRHLLAPAPLAPARVTQEFRQRGSPLLLGKPVLFEAS